MNHLNRYKRLLGLLLIPAFMFTCLKIHDITHPEDPKANTELEISVEVQLTRDGTGNHPAVFAILAPAVWDLANNAEMTISSRGYHDGDVTDEIMTVIADDVIEKQKGKPWKEALYEQYGYMDNAAALGELEWTAWVSDTSFDIVEASSNIDGTIKVKFPVNDDNIKVYMGYVFTTYGEGLNQGDEWTADKSKLLEVTGGGGATVDYTKTPTSYIESVTQPYKPLATDQLEIVAELLLNGKGQKDSITVFGMLAPKIWDIASTGQVTITTSGHLAGELNEAMVPIPAGELEPKSSNEWSEAFMDEFGKFGNYGDDVEWVMFKSQTPLSMKENDGKDVYATITLKLTPGPENIKFETGYGYCDYYEGFEDEYGTNMIPKTLIIGGGTNPVIDYRKDPEVEYEEPVLFSTIPSVFRYGDIFAIRFDAEGDYWEELVGAEEVFLYGKVIYDGGKEKIVDATLFSENYMNNAYMGRYIWEKYIYPRHFFELPEDAVIEDMYFHVSSLFRTIVIDNNGVDFHTPQSAE